jgi:hypothetical protein
MADRGVTRRDALRALGTGAGALTFFPFLSDQGLVAFAEAQRAADAPRLRVLSEEQYATVESLVEAILPADDRSPGAKEARVADYLDLLLSEAAPPLREEWIDGLRGLDAEASTRFGKGFARLSPDQVEALLTDVSRFETAPAEAVPSSAATATDARGERPVFAVSLMGAVSLAPAAPRRQPLEAFFAVTKDATLHGYYTSEIGLQQELRYKGNSILPEFVGCLTEDGKDCPHCGQKARA